MSPFQKSFETLIDLSSIETEIHLLVHHNMNKFTEMQAIQVTEVYRVTPWHPLMTTDQICPSYLKSKIYNLKVR